ncbi:MAG: 2,3-bisphosphoglycerate-independent phosphoglycerate mutase [Gammaproteobacteria bacterium]
MTAKQPLSVRPVILIILDGWGYSETTSYNAIHSAKKPVWDELWAHCPHTLVNASSLEVGLPAGQMGNSEVGHINIGSGRVVDQESTRITRAIESGEFFRNTTLNQALQRAQADGKAVHIMGLVSSGGVHSHQDHIVALLELAAGYDVGQIYLHAFLDGRDTPPKSAGEYLHDLQVKMQELGKGRYASIIGRYYAMDRNNNWERTRQAYDLVVSGKAEHHCTDAFVAVDMAYARGETDEFVQATAITDGAGETVKVREGDVVIFANYRADRARQLSEAMTVRDFAEFERTVRLDDEHYIGMTEYKEEFTFPAAFPPQRLEDVFGAYVAALGLRQLRIAETEKYAHVTFFFNGGQEKAFDNEDRILVPSPDVPTYDSKPEMSAREVTEKLLQAIRSKKYDTIICNFANADMVGHTGNFDAAVKAIEVIDQCLGEIVTATRAVGGEILITADHGNAEKMHSFVTEKDPGHIHTAHTSNPVPLIYVGRQAKVLANLEGGLCDIVPTMLTIMGLPQPAVMTGRPLLQPQEMELQANAAD